MQLKSNDTDNPDQRIAEDFRLFVDNSLSLGLGFLNAAVTLGSFVGILWALSGPLEVPFGGATYVIYGYMVWVAIIYAVLGTWLTHKIGKPLIPLNFNQQRFEADFRFNLVRFRENSEGVALYRGEEDELRGFRSRFTAVMDNWWASMKRQKLLNFFTTGYNQAAVVFPFVVGAPRYFSGAIPLGGLVQISNAFGQVQGALSWFIGAYTDFAAWKATVDRLSGFRKAIFLTQEESRAGAGPAVVSDATIDDLELRDLYNLEDPFHTSKDDGGAYRARLHANLAMHDRLDGKIDWPLGPDGAHPLTELLLADYMVVDITKPYADDSFFEIEQATLDGRAYQTCGGRSLNDDVIDKELTLLVNGGKGPRVSDGVDRPWTPVSNSFPYLAPPIHQPPPKPQMLPQ